MRHIKRGIDVKDLLVKSYAELYSYEDIDFVIRAYVNILGRFPDPEGERYYISRLQAGYSKVHLLDQLYRSNENKMAAGSVAGLSVQLRRYRRASLFGLRWFYRLMGYMEGNSRAERQGRALLRELAGIRKGIIQLGSGGHLAWSAQPGFPEASPEANAPSDHAGAATSTGRTVGLEGREFIPPLSMDSRTRRLTKAVEREILFIKRTI